jgi:hypothetical protein
VDREKQTQFKANSKPNKANRRKGEIDAKCVFTKDYEEKCGIGAMKNKAKTNPIRTQSKPIFVPIGLFIVYNLSKVLKD